MDVVSFIVAFGIIRILIGLAPLVAPRRSMELLDFPVEHDNPTARMMGRLFGVRDIGLGVMILLAVAYHPEFLAFVCLFNAAHDVGDAASFAIPLVRGRDVGRGGKIGLAVASSAVVAWLVAWSLV